MGESQVPKNGGREVLSKATMMLDEGGLLWRGGKKTAKGLSTHTFKIQPHTFYSPVYELGAIFAISDGKPSSHSLHLKRAYQLA